MICRQEASVEFEYLTDEDLAAKVSEYERLLVFEESEQWKMFNEACSRVAEKAKMDLIKTAPDNMVRIIELQQIIKLYSNVFKGLMNSFKQAGFVALKEEQSRNPIGSGSNP